MKQVGEGVAVHLAACQAPAILPCLRPELGGGGGGGEQYAIVVWAGSPHIGTFYLIF